MIHTIETGILLYSHFRSNTGCLMLLHNFTFLQYSVQYAKQNVYKYNYLVFQRHTMTDNNVYS